MRFSAGLRRALRPTHPKPVERSGLEQNDQGNAAGRYRVDAKSGLALGRNAIPGIETLGFKPKKDYNNPNINR